MLAMIFILKIELYQYQMTHSTQKHNSQLFNLNNGKINCDKIINNYLEMSLSPKVHDQVEQTKLWLKYNQKYAKQMVKQAEHKLRKALNSSSTPTMDVFSPDSNSITSMMMATTGKLSPKKLFNENEMERVIQQKQAARFNQINKKNHNKKIQSYLKIISKLQKQSQKEGEKEIKNDLSTKNKQQRQEKQNCFQNQYDRNQKQGFSKISSIDRKTLKYSVSKNQTDLSSYNSLNSSQLRQKNSFCTKKQNQTTQEQTKYHPFLERNLTMLYEPKRKRYRQGKFAINEIVKNGTYY